MAFFMLNIRVTLDLIFEKCIGKIEQYQFFLCPCESGVQPAHPLEVNRFLS